MTFQTPKRPLPDPTPNMENEIIRLMDLNQYAEAYQLLISLTNPSVSNLYNIALCLFKSRDYAGCIIQLEKIESKLQVNRYHSLNTNQEYNRILNIQRAIDTHLNAISNFYVEHFSHILYDSILRLRVDSWAQLKRWDKVLQIATKLQFKEYDNINRAIDQACNYSKTRK
ncbi:MULTISPECIES: hypothetical protein [Bacteroides]|uniref:hypothetical protein n=1 Tax=Bacteroides TaxID=816 RepID=UPI001E0A479A|nr:MULTISPECIES: hypothetical protein [Bacteroides]HJD92934.1 hypothetical protein [Bacteroides coprosuis]